MNLIEPKCIMWGETPYTFDESLKWIEKAGRTCYNSLHRMTENSAKPFVYDKTKNAHLSIIEHSNAVYRTVEKCTFPNQVASTYRALLNSQYIRVHVKEDYVYIAGNYRAFLEHLLCTKYHDLDIMKYISANEILECFDNLLTSACIALSEVSPCILLTNSEDIPNVLKRVTFEYLTDRAVTHELVRHRRAAFSQRSQRYVKENDLQIIKPEWFDSQSEAVKKEFIDYFNLTEKFYSFLISKEGAGLKAEQGRVMLPNATATIIVVTASINHWKWIIKLRDHDASYPSTRKLIKESKELMNKKGWL